MTKPHRIPLIGREFTPITETSVAGGRALTARLTHGRLARMEERVLLAGTGLGGYASLAPIACRGPSIISRHSIMNNAELTVFLVTGAGRRVLLRRIS
jgi:hypothetical protein